MLSVWGNAVIKPVASYADLKINSKDGPPERLQEPPNVVAWCLYIIFSLLMHVHHGWRRPELAASTLLCPTTTTTWELS